MLVTLTPAEVKYAYDVALARMSEGARLGMNHATTYKRSMQERVFQDTNGACGEYALAKWVGINDYQLTLNVGHEVPDVPPAFEVRTTNRDQGSLIVRSNDSPSRLYVLMVGDHTSFEVRGWLGGLACRNPAFVRDPNSYRPAWFVPQSALLNPEYIRKML